MNKPSDNPSSSSPSLVNRIDRACDAFELAWQDGEAPRIEAYLEQCAEGEQSLLLRELLRLEIDYRRQAGETLVAADYYQRFPEYRETVQSVLATEPAETRTFHVGSTDGSPRPSEAPRFVPGNKFGKYELVEQIGQGAFGWVYRARDLELDREVAIKIPRAGTLINKEDAHQFLREARSAGQLRHPNVVPIYDAGEIDGTCYIASAFVAGQTMREYIKQRGGLPPRECVELLATLASTLDYAHSNGVIHRDVKPENVVIDEAGRPHVMDFGLARRNAAAELQTQEGVQMGTPAYMSPEQAAGQSHLADRRSDLWALGVILYELLTGQRPFRGEVLELIRVIREVEPTRPQRLEKSIPRDLETICLKCLAKSPGQRYETCGELADELRRWLRNEPILARRVSSGERFWRWCRRNPVIAILEATVAVSLIIGACISTYFMRDAQEQAALYLGQKTRAEQEANKANLYAAEAKQKSTEAEQALMQREAALTEKTAALQQAERDRAEAVKSQLRETEAKNESQKRLAEHYLQLGYNFCDRGDIGQGLMNFAAALREVPENETHLERLIRLNLSAWQRDLCPIKSLTQLDGEGKVLSWNARWLAVSTSNTTRLWDVRAGVPVGPDLRIGRWLPFVVASDGRMMISGHQKTLRIWNARTGRSTDRSHSSKISAISISPDDSTILIGTSAGTARLYNTRDGTPTSKTCLHKYEVGSGLFCPNGKSVLTAGFVDDLFGESEDGNRLEENIEVIGDRETAVGLWDVTTGQFLIPALKDQAVTSAAFGPDGEKLITSSSSGVHVWTIGDSSAEVGQLITREKMVALGFLDSKNCVLAAGRRWSVRDIDSGQVSYGSNELVGGLTTFGINREDRSIVATARNVLYEWSYASSHTPFVHSGVDTVAIDELNGLLVTLDGEAIRRWDISTMQPVGLDDSGDSNRASTAPFSADPFGRIDRLPRFAARWLSPDGKSLVGLRYPDPTTNSNQNRNRATTLQLWNVATNAPIGEPMVHEKQLAGVTFAGQFLLTKTQDSAYFARGVPAANDSLIRRWDAATSELVGEPMTDRTSLIGHSKGIPISQNHEFFATVNDENCVYCWDTATGNRVGLPLAHGSTEAVAMSIVSPKGQSVLTQSLVDVDRGLGQYRPINRLWNLQTGEVTRILPRVFEMVEFAPNGVTFVIRSDPRTVEICDAVSGGQVGEPLKHDEVVEVADFSQDGNTLLTLSGGNLRMWRTSTGSPQGAIMGDEARIRIARFSPDGKLIVAATDRWLRFWDPISGQPIGGRVTGAALKLRIANNGRHVLATGGSTSLLIPTPTQLPGEAALIDRWTQVNTAMTVGESGRIVPLTPEAWQAVRRQLEVSTPHQGTR